MIEGFDFLAKSLTSLVIALSIPAVIVVFFYVRIEMRRADLMNKIQGLFLELEYLRVFHNKEWNKVNKNDDEAIQEEYKKAADSRFKGENSLKNYLLPFVLTAATTGAFALVVNQSLRFPVSLAAYLQKGVLPLAIFGALLYVFPQYIAGYASLSLNPARLYGLAGKLWLSSVVGILLATIVADPLRPLGAFLGALLPITALSFLKKRIFPEGDSRVEFDRLSALMAVLHNDEDLLTQLHFIGVRSVVELAHENPMRIFMETDLNLDCCIYLIDEANLHLYVPDAAVRAELNRCGIRTAVDLMTEIYDYVDGVERWILPGETLPSYLNAPFAEMAKILKLESVDTFRNYLQVMCGDPKLQYILEFWTSIERNISRICSSKPARAAKSGSGGNSSPAAG